MAKPRNPDGYRLRGFPRGVNNVAPPTDIPNDEFGNPMALAEAVNVDFVGPSKRPRRREGYTRIVEGRCHSPVEYEHELLVVVDGNLERRTRGGSFVATIRPDVGDRHISYADVHGDMYWSNGVEFRCVRDDQDVPGWIDCPGTPNVEAHPSGGMAAGEYRVAMTWLDSEGRESGAVGIALVEIAEGQGIRVFDIPAAPEGAAVARVYASTANGDELYAAIDMYPSVTQTLISVGMVDAGRVLETLWRQPMPPCNILRFWNGRLLGAATNLLVWSDALRFGLTTHDNYIRFGEGITLLEPVGDGGEGSGVWLADHKRTYWMSGANPKDWNRVIKSDTAAVPGTSLVVDGSDIGLDVKGRVAVWVSSDGVFTAGLPGGQLVDLTRDTLAMPEGEYGAMMLRSRNGLTQLVASYITTGANPLAVTDTASATVIRRSTP